MPLPVNCAGRRPIALILDWGAMQATVTRLWGSDRLGADPLRMYTMSPGCSTISCRLYFLHNPFPRAYRLRHWQGIQVITGVCRYTARSCFILCGNDRLLEVPRRKNDYLQLLPWLLSTLLQTRHRSRKHGLRVQRISLFTAQSSLAGAVLGIVILSVSLSVCHTRAS